MTDPIVTHEDLDAIVALVNSPVLRGLDESTGESVLDLLRRLRAAAEADRPPLPEGWYLWDAGGARSVVYVTGEHMSRWDDGDGYFGKTDRDRLTPLHPTVTNDGLCDAYNSLVAEWSGKPLTVNAVERAFEAAGIEVRDA